MSREDEIRARVTALGKTSQKQHDRAVAEFHVHAATDMRYLLDRCLLPDDDTAVERLADVLPWFGEWYGDSVEMNSLDPSIGPRDVGEAEHDAAWHRLAAAIIERLREGGHR